VANRHTKVTTRVTAACAASGVIGAVVGPPSCRSRCPSHSKRIIARTALTSAGLVCDDHLVIADVLVKMADDLTEGSQRSRLSAGRLGGRTHSGRVKRQPSPGSACLAPRSARLHRQMWESAHKDLRKKSARAAGLFLLVSALNRAYGRCIGLSRLAGPSDDHFRGHFGGRMQLLRASRCMSSLASASF